MKLPGRLTTLGRAADFFWHPRRDPRGARPLRACIPRSEELAHVLPTPGITLSSSGIRGENVMNCHLHIRQKGQRGFTLIELLIVVAVIGIIVSMLIPNLLDAFQKAKQKRTMADMKILGTAMF